MFNRIKRIAFVLQAESSIKTVLSYCGCRYSAFLAAPRVTPEHREGTTRLVERPNLRGCTYPLRHSGGLVALAAIYEDVR